ncbi:MAG: PrsW family intramembrane metalloprotease [Halobacteriales archaeon]
MSDENKGDNVSEEGSDGSSLLYGVTEWEPRSPLDVFFYYLYGALVTNVKLVAVGVLVLILFTNVSFDLAGLFLNPIVGTFAVISVLPAGFIAVYVWESDPTAKRPALYLAVTFALGTVATTLAYFINTSTVGWFEALPFLSMALFFFILVGPVEEILKLGAVYIYPYGTEGFGTALDGAVFGAFAGLGFATAENALYIATEGLIGGGGLETLIGRAGVAPAHVMWSAIAGYYLGLAYVTKEYAGVLIFKGLVTVAVLHGTYNTFMTYAPLATGVDTTEVAVQVANFVFLVGFYGVVGYILHSLIRRYRRADKEVGLRQ